MPIDRIRARDPIIALGPLVVGVVLSRVVGREVPPECTIKPVVVVG